MKITFVGQSTFRIVTESGTVILTDPWFTGYPHLRTTPPALHPSDFDRLDLMLVSHNHIDHVDRIALRLAARTNALVVGPRPIAARARRRGAERAVALSLRDDFAHDGVKIHSVPADHPLCSSPFGYLIQADGKTIYFSGDTRNFPALRQVLKSRPIDLALIQIACAKYFGIPDGMSIEAAAALVREVKPREVVPMHYHGRFKEADPERFKAALDHAESAVRIFQPGKEEVL